jgi:hypothetical protein
LLVAREVKDLSPLSGLKHLRKLHLSGLDVLVIATLPSLSDQLDIDMKMTSRPEITPSLYDAFQAAEEDGQADLPAGVIKPPNVRPE